MRDKKINFLRVILITNLLLIIIGIFSQVMTSFDHNEHMYITASVLVSKGFELYKDFAYLQMPYLPLLYGFLYKILSINSHYFFVGKLVSFIFIISSALILFSLTKRIFQNIDISIGIVTIFLLNSTIINASSEVSNYSSPLFFSLAGFYITYTSMIKKSFKQYLTIFGGLFVGLSIGIKLTYAPIMFPFLIMCIFYPIERGDNKRNLKLLLFFVIGLIASLLPILIFIRYWDIFLFNNLGYHSYNATWRILTDYPGPMTLVSKIIFFAQILLRTENIILVFGIIFGIIFTTYRHNQLKFLTKKLEDGVLFVILFVIISIITAIVPTPSFSQYFAMPLSFLVLLLVFSHASELSNYLVSVKKSVLFLTFMISVFRLPAMITSIPNAFFIDNWAPNRIYFTSINMKQIIEDIDINSQSKVATLSPLFAIEGNLPIYNELSTGPFLYRIGDFLTSEQKDRFIATSPQDIEELLYQDPPVAILTGLEGNLDLPLVNFALENSYKQIEIPGFPGDLFTIP